MPLTDTARIQPSPHVSVCIPAHRQASDLERTLDSLVVQRFTDYEVVITDDSPDDAVEALIRSYDFGGRLRYFRNPHPLDVPGNWDEAIRLSHAPLIKMLHPDERLAHADALGRFVALMEENPDCPFGFAASRTDAGGAVTQNVPTPAELSDLKRRPERLLLKNVIGPPGATIHRRALALHHDPRLAILADVDFAMRALRTSPRFAYTDEVLIATSEAMLRETALADIAEMREALLMFEKAFDQLQDDEDVAVFWWRGTRRLKVHNVKQLARICEPSPAVAAWFRELFAHPPPSERRGLSGFLKGMLRPGR